MHNYNIEDDPYLIIFNENSPELNKLIGIKKQNNLMNFN